MNNMSINDVSMVPVTDQSGKVVGYQDEVNQLSMPLIQEEHDSYETAQNYEEPRATFSAEDIVGLIFCLGGLNPLCMTACAMLFGPSAVTNPPETEEDKQVEASILKATNFNVEVRQQGMMELYNLAQTVESLDAKARMLWPLIRHLKDQDLECRKVAAMTLRVLAVSDLSDATKAQMVDPLIDACKKEDMYSPAEKEMNLTLNELRHRKLIRPEQSGRIHPWGCK